MDAVKITTSEIQQFELEHSTALRNLAPECMVLLKKNGDFPLESPCEIALYGSGARKTIKGGTGSGDVNVRHFTSVEEGLEKAGFTITTKVWLDAYDAAKAGGRDAFFAQIIEQAKQEGKLPFLVGLGKTIPEPEYDIPLDGTGDVCVYVLGRVSGEGADRPNDKGDFLLSDDEVRDILLCAKKYQKFLLVLNVGGVVDLSPVVDQVDNILLLSQLGTVTGDSFADVLLGKAYPSGKLATTWARAEDYQTIGDFAQRDDTRYREGIYVGYRYFDAAGIQPIFPFGYGITYTDFDKKVESFQLKDGTIEVAVQVTNIGNFPGKETVMLYYSAPNGKLDKPVRELGAYAKTQELLPGASEVVVLALPAENMACWDSQNATWLMEQGAYIISVGDDAVGVAVLDEDVVTGALSHIDGGADYADWKPASQRVIPEGLPTVQLCAADLKNAGHYDRNRLSVTIPELPVLTDFTDQELAQICVGKHASSAGIASIVGNSAFAIAGAAGETADVVTEKGYGKMVLADGPAGIRISTQYIETENGPQGLDNGSLEEYLPLLGEQIKSLLDAKRAAVNEMAKSLPIHYHYASAIPIGTAIAQSWNLDLARTCGDIVGKEMELFGINVWLAPALNIHRSPLCGRNFEYYSEDPYISGKVAAAVTLGVQVHECRAVTIKHFACNNQETNRFNSNSIVSERALREIYLKGFEICVKEAAPLAIMSSYNLLGGIHTANRRDLLTDILRDEWGFSGFVMTDWSTTTTKQDPNCKYGPSSDALCIKAGNDLIMPGCDADVNGILTALGNGTLTRGELETCAGRILSVSRLLSAANHPEA